MIRNSIASGVTIGRSLRSNSKSELVERATVIEVGIEEEKQMNRAKLQAGNNQAAKNGDRKRKFDKIKDSKSDGKHVDYTTCGKRHNGECWKASVHVLVAEVRMSKSKTVLGSIMVHRK